MFKYNLVLGRTKHGLTTHGAYNNIKQLLPLVYQPSGHIYKNHVFVASPEMCEYIRNYALDSYRNFEDMLIWPCNWEFKSWQRTFVIGDDSLANLTLSSPDLDTVLVTNWDSSPMCSGLDFKNQFYPHEGTVPSFARGFSVFHRVGK